VALDQPGSVTGRASGVPGGPTGMATTSLMAIPAMTARAAWR